MSRTNPRVSDREPYAFEISVDIAAPPQRVWQVMTDVERWPEWTASVTSVRRLDSGGLRVGSRARIKQPKFLPAIWQVTQLDSGRSFAWNMRSPGVRATGIHQVKPTSNGSRATLAVVYDGVLAPVVATLLGGVTNRFLALEAAGLRKRSEAKA
jgi:uncharacterized protein YndB with AHSA1/START domain